MNGGAQTRDKPFAGEGPGLAVDAAAGPGLCVDGPPRLGDNCPKDPGAEFRCEYTIDECVQGESRYPVIQYYCCFEGTWDTCGGNKTPCDDIPPQPGENDGGTDARDAGADGIDAPGDI